MQLSGAEIIVKLLERQGVTQVSGIPGGANLPLYDALKTSSIRHILARHEQGAGFIAQGMARASGRTSVCFATSGPGVTNLLTAIADARLDSIPIIAITGQVPLSMIGTDAFQEIDTYGLTLPVTKHNYLVRSVEELLTVIPKAFQLAASGRPGPVAIDVPKDLQFKKIEVTEWPEPGGRLPAKGADDAVIDQMVDIINQSKRPMFYIGGGIIHAGAAETVRRIAEKASIPTTSTLMGLGAIPSNHPLFMGMLGMHAARYTNMALDECDLLIAAGVRFDDRATGKVAQFCSHARIIHIDIDPSELGKIKMPFVGVEGDVGKVLAAAEDRIKAVDRSEWLNRICELKTAHPLLMPGADDPMSPYGLVLQAAATAEPDAIITTDVGQHQMWVAQSFPFSYPRQLLTSGGLGTMGFGLPAAIGAGLAYPNRQIICFTGDGSLLMNIQELATAVEEGVNIKVVVMNNSHLGLVRQQQELFYGARFSASRFHAEPDFAAVARGFGVEAVDLGTASNPRSALKKAFEFRGPCLINVPIPAEEKVFPMVPPGAANRDMIGGENHVDTRR
ncbi:MAG TPA: acetolactate synthase large subunit [Acidobacteriota bacterium]|mgnify:CR=1 FL=1|nr:acetolactate synthase large subunit [Acidobacteriota bacterium]